jgi:hypothetical protein
VITIHVQVPVEYQYLQHLRIHAAGAIHYRDRSGKWHTKSAGNRTASGKPSADARAKHGIDKSGRFPIFDKQSAHAALKLRGHAKDKAERKKIIIRAGKYVPDAAKTARKVDKDAGKI